MRKFLLLPFLLTLTLFSKAQTKEESSVNQAVIDFFNSMSAADTARLKQLSADDFILLENGEVWKLQMLTDYLKGIDTSRLTRINNLQFIHTEVTGTTAWTAYHNNAIITADGNSSELHWLESACLVKEGRKWKIRLLHSTKKHKE